MASHEVRLHVGREDGPAWHQRLAGQHRMDWWQVSTAQPQPVCAHRMYALMSKLTPAFAYQTKQHSARLLQVASKQHDVIS